MKLFFTTIRKVFTRPLYGLIAFVSAFALLAVAVWLPNFSFLVSAMAAPGFSLQTKFGILVASFSALGTNFTLLSRTLTITLAVLFGVNTALLAFYLRTRFRLERSAGVGIGGIIAGLLGVGCASCGSVVFSAFLGVGATAGFLNILPLKGQEFGIIGVVLMLVAIVLTAKKIEQPLSCEVVDF